MERERERQGSAGGESGSGERGRQGLGRLAGGRGSVAEWQGLGVDLGRWTRMAGGARGSGCSGRATDMGRRWDFPLCVFALRSRWPWHSLAAGATPRTLLGPLTSIDRSRREQPAAGGWRGAKARVACLVSDSGWVYDLRVCVCSPPRATRLSLPRRVHVTTPFESLTPALPLPYNILPPRPSSSHSPLATLPPPTPPCLRLRPRPTTPTTHPRPRSISTRTALSHAQRLARRFPLQIRLPHGRHTLALAPRQPRPGGRAP